MVDDFLLQHCCKMFLFVSFVIVPVLGSWDLSHPGCGVKPPMAVSNGKPVDHHPWMVFLYLLSNATKSFCGGSMINDLQILTAAHCVVGKTTDDIGVIIGNTNATKELLKFNFHFVYKIDVYPFFDQNVDKIEAIKNNSDVAVLTLETAVPLGPSMWGVWPICLPSFSDSSNTYEGLTGTVAGWGEDENGQESVDQLMGADVPIISNTQCETFYPWLKSFHLCTHKQGSNRGHCKGDSGGPLFIKRSDDRFVQIAVASFGSNKTCATTPGGFSRLSYDVLQWIRTIKVDSWQHKVNREMSDMKTELSELKQRYQEQQSRIADLSHTGSWCSFQNEWTSGYSVIRYETILHEDSNMIRNAYAYIRNGVFTAPHAGVYLITFSYLGGNDPNEQTWVYIYKNGNKINQTEHGTYYGSRGTGQMGFTSGRAVYKRLKAGDTLTLQTNLLTGNMYHIIFCVQFINN